MITAEISRNVTSVSLIWPKAAILAAILMVILYFVVTCVTNWGEAGLGWRPVRPTTDYQGFSRNRHNPVMVYIDLMIRNITVHNYNKDRSQPVTIQCIYTWVGAPVDRRRLTGMICPDRALISVRIIVPFFCMASRPLSTSHQLILAIDIV